MARKVFVGVKITVDIEGKVTPLSITWEDGRVFEIDQVTEIRRAASMSAGGVGIRYTCMINGKPKHLYFEDPRWFMEGK